MDLGIDFHLVRQSHVNTPDLFPAQPQGTVPQQSQNWGEPTPPTSYGTALRWTMTRSMWDTLPRGFSGKFILGYLVFVSLWGLRHHHPHLQKERASFPEQLAPAWQEQDKSQTCHSHFLPLLSLATTRDCREEIALAGSWGTQVVPAAASASALAGSTSSNTHRMLNTLRPVVREQELGVLQDGLSYCQGRKARRRLLLVRGD